MARKPTYEELEQRIKELEIGTTEHGNEDEELLTLQALFDNIQVGLHIYHLEDINDDKTLKMISANQAAADFTGVPIKDVVGKTLDDNFPNLREKGIPQIYAEVVRSGKSRVLEDIYYGDNRVIESVFSVEAFPLPNNCVGVSFENVTELRKIEDARKESEEKYRLLFETMTEGVCLHEMIYDDTGNAIDYKITDVNPSYESITGMKKEIAVGSIASELYGTDEAPFLDIYAKVADTREGTAFDIFWPPMEKHFQISVISPDKGKFATVFTNLTDRLQAEEALRESLQRLEFALQGGNLGMWDWNPQDGGVVYNDLWAQMLEYRPDEVEPTLEFFKQHVHPEDLAAVLDRLTGHVEGRLPVYESEHRIRTKSGRWLLWVLDRGRIAERDKDGSPVRVTSIIADITERKRAEAEREKLQAQLIQAQKMETIGTLAGGIAHDFNNILSPIMIHSEMVMMELPSGSPLQQNMKEIYRAGERARDMVRQILTFTRKQEGERVRIEMSRILKEAIKFLRSSIPTTIDFQYNIETEQDTVFADPTQLNQIIMNLCTNASHAMEENGGTLEVNLKNENLDPESSEEFHDLEPGRYVKLTVKDTGQGIEPEIIDKIFDPYFTTKDVDKGTGMGLALVHGIVKGYGGAVTVRSEPSKGTSFHVYLPVAEEEADVPEPRKDSVELPTGSERILFVDDEKLAVDIIQSMLEKLGYKVTARTSSIEALEAFRNNPQGFDLVITDMTMPNMTGKDLAKEMMTIRSDIPIILCTGFSEQIDETRAKEMGISAYVMKPIVLSQIAKTIRKVLDPSPSIF